MGTRTDQIKEIVARDFAAWGLTNYKDGYRHLTKVGAERVINDGAKLADARLHMGCHAFLGKRKSTAAVIRTGRSAFQNGGGCCTTSAFAVAYKLLDAGIRDRVEIIGQGSMDNGHMWVVVGRTGGAVQDGKVKRPDNGYAEWGSYIAVDVWLKAFGWEGVWKKPEHGMHHFFIENDHTKLEITYDSLVEDGDD
jgi:hypothetical protein